jgi:multidrug efflux pump subunit AcrA (membrane-fusion protein)
MFTLFAKPWRALAVGVIVAGGLVGCRKAYEEQEEGQSLPKEPVSVRAVKAERANLRPSIDVVGSIVAIPERTTSISPQIAGCIQAVRVVEGDHVRAGAEILHLDPRMAEAELAKAAASVSEKGAVLERLKHGPRPEEIEMTRHDAHKAQITMESLRGEVAALKALRASNEVSALQFQKTSALLQAAEAENASAAAKVKLLQAGTRPEEIAEAEARLAAAKTEQAAAKLNLELCTIVSPLDGTVTQLTARQGMYVDHTASLATVVDLSRVFMQIRVPSAYLASVKAGGDVDVRPASLPGKNYRGKIARISGQADVATGDVDAMALLANEDGLLRPGLACRGRVWLPEMANVLVVPVGAVADRAGTAVVTVIRDKTAHEVEVALGLKTEDQVQVVRGVVCGDWVVTEGGYGLPENCPVRLIEAPAHADKLPSNRK